MASNWLASHFFWLVGLNIDRDCLVSHWIMGSHEQWEFPPFVRPQWQSLCTALLAGKCLPLGLCKGTVKESIPKVILWPPPTALGPVSQSLIKIFEQNFLKNFFPHLQSLQYHIQILHMLTAILLIHYKYVMVVRCIKLNSKDCERKMFHEMGLRNQYRQETCST